MPAVSANQRRRFVACAIVLSATFGASLAQAETVTIRVDQAQLMQLPEQVSSIVIGNPMIADATLQRGGHLVLTGKGYGATNLLALDRSGHVVLDKTIQVLGPSRGNLVVVFKGIERETYSCAPNCERRVTLGDSPAYFGATVAQISSRNNQAQSTSQAK
jgi:Pilus formation protein N terminal region